MHAKVTVLVDNQTGEQLSAEHGLSLWIETSDTRVLFDTGQGTALQGNAQELGIVLDEADILVLSHGHYDHTGGVAHVLKHAQQLEVYCHPGVIQPRYSIRNGRPKSIQMPRESMAAIDNLPAQRLHWTTGASMLSQGIGITGPIPRDTCYEDTGGPFFLDPEGLRGDPIADDIALWIHTADGLVVFVGCCHAGLVNTVSYARNASGFNKVRGIIGGLHLQNASKDRLRQTCMKLLEWHLDFIVPCHCTGKAAVSYMRQKLGKNIVQPGHTGTVIDI